MNRTVNNNSMNIDKAAPNSNNKNESILDQKVKYIQKTNKYGNKIKKGDGRAVS